MNTPINAACVAGILCTIEKLRNTGFRAYKCHGLFIILCSQNFGQTAKSQRIIN